jgi:hypothetical protein
MNQFRVLTVLAALGASAGLANAQSVSVASMQAVADTALAQVRPGPDYRP